MGRTMGCWLAARRPAIAGDEDGLSVGGELLNVNGSDFFLVWEPEKGTQNEETQVPVGFFRLVCETTITTSLRLYFRFNWPCDCP